MHERGRADRHTCLSTRPPSLTHADCVVMRQLGRGQQWARQRGRGRPLVFCPTLTVPPTCPPTRSPSLLQAACPLAICPLAVPLFLTARSLFPSPQPSCTPIRDLMSTCAPHMSSPSAI